MKYVRLRIANYRGVDKADIQFADTGITLIRGPNEVGKTSLGEALRLLFEYPDSSRHHDINAIKPVNRDEGPEIELEAYSGPYHFTYFKRYFKRPETRLTIIKPKAESLTGRSAHDRADTILQETLDVALWKALSIKQGSEIDQPTLKGQIWLSQALDQAAGGSSADPKAESLFEAIHQEYLKYFTENGADRKDLVECRKAMTNCQYNVQSLEQTMHDLEQDIDRSATLGRELAKLRQSQLEIDNELESRSAKLEEIGRLDRILSEAELKMELAKASASVARSNKDKREKLIKEVTSTTEATAKIGESVDSRSKDLEQAKSVWKKAADAFSDAENKKKEIIQLIDLRRGDHEYLHNVLDLQLLQERRDRIDRARKQAAKSAEILETNKIDEKGLEDIETAQNNVIRAKSKLEAKAPTVSLHGFRECKLTKDGEAMTLRKGQLISYPVPDCAKFVLAESVEIEINAGSSIETLSKKFDEAEENLKLICSSLGITSADAARKTFEIRQKAENQIAALIQVENENLRDLSYEELLGKLSVLQRSVPAYLPTRVGEPKILDDLDATKAELDRLEKQRRRVEIGWESNKTSLEEAKTMYEMLNSQYIEANAHWVLGKKSLAELQTLLQNERLEMSDKTIDEMLSNATRDVETVKTDVESTRSTLKALNPEQEKELDKTARESMKRLGQRITEATAESIAVSTRLKINGEDGLFDKLGIAQALLARSQYENAALTRLASASKLLFETMREERDKARHAYIAPLKEKIEALGRLVFDDSLHIGISDELQIVSRTLQDATVDFDSLSGGTKEQLSVIFRLACAMMVAKDGGAPVMLDDALGYTDPERLRLMGAVLARAASKCQIVIFTCLPDRYSNIGAAKEIVLAK